MTLKMPYTRLVAYLLIIALLPLIAVMMGASHKRQEYYQIQESLQQMEMDVLFNQQACKAKEAIQRRYAYANHFYVDQVIEPLKLLSKTLDHLNDFRKKNPDVADHRIEERISYLERENRLTFKETRIENQGWFTQTEEVLTHSVEVDLKDLETILKLIEMPDMETNNPNLRAPQMAVTDLTLRKKKSLEGSVFELTFNFLKREYHE